MPILSRSNARVLPTNSRAVEVAVSTIQAVADTQRLKHHNAFQVQGYEAVLYHRLTCGLQCSCQAKSQSIASRLDQDGKATPGLMNELLTGGLEFGVLNYRRSPADPVGFNPLAPDPVIAATGKTLFSIDQSKYNATRKPEQYLPSLYDEDALPLRTQDKGRSRSLGAPADMFGGDADTGASTVVSSGIGPNGIVHDLEFQDIIPDADVVDISYMGSMDNACPICFGMGYVGGFTVYNGWRLVLNHQFPSLLLPDAGEILFDEFPISIKAKTAVFTANLPVGAISVDAFKVWNNLKPIPATIDIDGVKLSDEIGLLRYCDGRPHTITVSFDEPTIFTHLELQVNQSTKVPFLDFPKMSRSSVQTVLENLDDFQLVVSPIVPVVRPNDFIAESTYGKVLQVKSCTQSNDRNLNIHGWECDVRPIQPKEITSLLPKRRKTMRQPQHKSLPRPTSKGSV